MRWIIVFFIYFILFFLHTKAARRPPKTVQSRACRPSSYKCAQKCYYYPRKGPRCRCHNGFAISKTNSKDCVDEDECLVNNGNCEHSCSNTPGSYWCSCRPGYRLANNQRNCVPITSTDCVSGHPCQHFCNRTSTGHVCSCRRGYRLHSNGRNCIRMCLYGNGGCHHICNREGDRMFCTCRPHYMLSDDGRTCRVQHSCAVDNGGCNAACEDTPIGVQCSCSAGYLLRNDQRSCQDIDECADNNGGCEQGCRNSQGSYICTCPAGYKLASDERSCVDIDECHLNDTCWSGCVNSPGSYTCTCDKGFQKFAVKRCGDINECTVNNGGCAHSCVNTFGGYKCSCNRGYKLHWNEKDCVRAATCYTLRRLPPPALLRCVNQECFLDCRTTSNFLAYYSPTPSYKYVCGREEGGPPKSRTKRGEVTSRPLWWKNNLEVNDTLPDCAAPAKQVYSGRFSLKVDHCHLLRVSTAPSSSTHQHRASINYFSITCATTKKRKRTKVIVNISFNYRFSSKKCDANCRRAKANRAGKRMLNTVKRSIRRQLFRLGFNTANLLIRKKSTSKRETRPIPGIHSPAGCLYGRTLDPKKSCALCDSGTFFNVLTSLCEPCPPGTYQGRKGQLSCNQCPRTGLNNRVSSVAIQQCPGVCPTGQFSADGFLPCRPCPIGTYQPETGRIGCFRCGQRLTTRDIGSESFSSCLVRVICTAGHFYNPLTSSCKRCPVGFYQPDPGKDFCFSCPGNTTTDYDASDSVESCKDTHCGGVIGDLHGVIESPNYPGDYPINSRCTWLIRPPKNRKLLLVIPEIFLPGLDCEDSLVMRSRRGPGDGKVSYESCQTFENPFAFTALSKRLYVEFNSNDNVCAKGFQIPYVTYDENYDVIIQDIVRDSRLLSPDLFQPILKDKLSRQTLFEVLAKPEMYFNLSREKTNELFPPSFIAFLEQKVTKFFSH